MSDAATSPRTLSQELDPSKRGLSPGGGVRGHRSRVRLLLPPDRNQLAADARVSLLAEWMSDWLRRNVMVTVASTYGEMVDAVKGSETELAWTPPVVFAGLHGSTRFALTAQRQGVCSSRGAIIVRRNEHAGSIA